MNFTAGSVGNKVRRSNSSQGVQNILNPVRGYRDALVRKGITPRNFEKENRMSIRIKQLENQLEKQKIEEAPPKVPFKLKQFAHVPARVQTKSKLKPRRYSEPGVHSRSVKPAVPTRKEILDRLREKTDSKNVNYIQRNKRKVMVESGSKNEEIQPSVRHKSYGKLPMYLIKRQLEWAKDEEERQASLPDPSCPRGMKVMDEDERLETLRVLLQSERVAQDQLYKLPLTIDTPKQQERKNVLEGKLKEIEDAIIIFQRPRVLIAAA